MEEMQIKHAGGHSHHEEESTKDYLIFGLILAGIVAGAWIVTQVFGLVGNYEFMRALMGVFFLTFAGFKLVDVAGFAESFAQYDLFAMRSKLYAKSYPYIELGLGIAYLANILPQVVNWVTFAIMTVGAVGVGKQLLAGNKIHCACLGSFVKLPLTKVSLTEDLAMGIMALLVLVR